jgi:hypothetical protein
MQIFRRACVSYKNGEGALVVMDIEMFTRREKMLRLREELLAVEEDRLAGRAGSTPYELESYLESIIDEVEHGKNNKIQSLSIIKCLSKNGI